MPNIRVIDGHELVNLVNEDDLFDAADLNGISITDDLIPGTFITVTTLAKPKLTNEIIDSPAKVLKVRAEAGQTLTDLTLQQLGDEERLFEMADSNGVSITDDVPIGTEITYPTIALDKKKIATVLQTSKPASEVVVSSGEETQEGIEYWTTEQDFIVS